MASCNYPTPPSCARGCGFFGSPENSNLFSKCYRDVLKEKIVKSTRKLSELVNAPSIDQGITNDTSETTSTTTTAAAAVSCSSVKNTRCQCCNKKIGLMEFKCRCGKVLCGVHRYAKEHSCTFNFKTLDRQILAKQNPLVMGDKLRSKGPVSSRNVYPKWNITPSFMMNGRPYHVSLSCSKYPISSFVLL